MDIVRVIERKLGRLLGRGASGGSDLDKSPPAATPRFCQFGHAVFAGNNLCNYGHRPA
jgi:hypothetical protein